MIENNNLSVLRARIDEIDDKIIELLETRLKMVVKIAQNKDKNSIYCPKREEEIINRLNQKPLKYLDKITLTKIYYEIFSGSKELQENTLKNKK
ncbi:chorismate mutase [Helicobacter cetorum]|uniref:chorismate mutase n=1 Tax=Helicobacter cetorum TaxID=138563 RepID=UPI000CF0D5CE|nr:chorismate mutase [Helicobacter cetorum]